MPFVSSSLIRQLLATAGECCPQVPSTVHHPYAARLRGDDQYLYAADSCAGSGAGDQFTVAGWRWWWFAAGLAILVLIGGSTAGVMKYFGSRFPNAAEQALLAQVPLALTMKDSCTRNEAPERDTVNVQASVTCTADGDTANTVVFTKFTSAKALDSHYQTAVATAGIGPSSGDCLNTERAEGTYASESSWTMRADCVLPTARFVVRCLD